jgi:hypothetical protein
MSRDHIIRQAREWLALGQARPGAMPPQEERERRFIAWMRGLTPADAEVLHAAGMLIANRPNRPMPEVGAFFQRIARDVAAGRIGAAAFRARLQLEAGPPAPRPSGAHGNRKRRRRASP